MQKDTTNTLTKYKRYLCGEHNNTNTINSYYICAKHFQQYTKGKINTTTIQQYKQHIKQKYHKTRNTQRTRLNGMNLYLKYLQTPSDWLVKIPPQENTNQKTLNEKQIDTLITISQYNPETHLILLLLWDGCLRPNTIINIKIKDRTDRTLQLNQTKTGNHHINMSKQLIYAWDKYLTIRPIPQTEYKEYLLINPYKGNQGKKYQDIQHIIHTITRLSSISNIPYRVTPYTIRRTSATLRQNRFSKYHAGDPKLVQKMFNHQDIKTTMRYNQKTDNDIQEYLDHLTDNQEIYYRNKSYLSPQNTLKNFLKNENENQTNNIEKDDNGSFSFSFLLSFHNHIHWSDSKKQKQFMERTEKKYSHISHLAYTSVFFQHYGDLSVTSVSPNDAITPHTFNSNYSFEIDLFINGVKYPKYNNTYLASSILLDSNLPITYQSNKQDETKNFIDTKECKLSPNHLLDERKNDNIVLFHLPLVTRSWECKQIRSSRPPFVVEHEFLHLEKTHNGIYLHSPSSLHQILNNSQLLKNVTKNVTCYIQNEKTRCNIFSYLLYKVN